MGTQYGGKNVHQPGSLSRRRVLQVATWTAPAIVIASAAPAAAASETELASVALQGVSASMTDNQLRVGGRVAYVGDADAISDLPVSDVTLGVRVPSNRLTTNPSVVLTPEWESFAVDLDGLFSIFTFKWKGEPLTADYPITLPLEAYLSKAGSLDPLDVTFIGDGASGAEQVPTVVQDVVVEMGAEVKFRDNKPVRYQRNFNTGTERIEVYAFDATTQWAGPYRSDAPDVTDLTATVRVPHGLSTGRVFLDDSSSAPNWTLVEPASLLDGFWVAQARYALALGPNWQNSSTLRFAFEVAGEPQELVADLRSAGDCVGLTAIAQARGPQNVLVSDEWTDPPLLGGEIKEPIDQV